MKKVIFFFSIILVSLISAGIVTGENNFTCVDDSNCIIKAMPYCCGDQVEYANSCFNLNETPQEVNCTINSPCPGILKVDYCKCESNKCIGKSNLTCANENEMCAGFAGIACCGGLECVIEEDYFDAAGICLNKTILCEDRCGDGNCDEIVCQGEGCPCAETEESCPEDCGKKSRSLIYSVILFIAAVVLIFIAYKMTKWFLWILALAAAAAAFYFIFIR